MATPVITQAISSKALTKESLLEALNREVIPAVRAMRALWNKRHDEVFGDGAATVFAFTHGLGVDSLLVQVWDEATGAMFAPAAITSIVRTDGNTLTVTMAAAPAASGARVVIRA